MAIYKFTEKDINLWAECKVDVTLGGAPVSAGEEFEIGLELRLRGQSGVTINSDGTYLYGRGGLGEPLRKSFSTNLENTVATLTLATSDKYSDFEKFYCSTNLPAPSYLYTISQADLDDAGSKFIKIKVNGAEINSPTGVSNGDKIELVTSDYDLVSDANYLYGRGDFGEPRYFYFSISDDKKLGELTVNSFSGNYERLNLESTPSSSSVGNSNSFIVTDSDIEKINNDRFVLKNDELIDYGQFIISLLQLPYKLPESYIGDLADVYLANIKTSVNTNKLKNYLIELDLGIIKTPAKNNILDYFDTVCVLYLPRIEPINIDPTYVIGYELSVKYIIDVYSGNVSVIINSSNSDSPIINKVVNLGVNIPMGNPVNSGSVINNNIVIGADNGILTPYVEIMRGDFKDFFFNVPVKDELKISECTGYIEIEKIKLTTKATYYEKDAIINMLKSGVIIK